MKFLNLDTGYSFDGLWSANQEKGYVFWFPKEQSIGITYSMPICVLTDTNTTELQLRIEDNPIFSFVNHKALTTVDGYEFYEPEYSTAVTAVPETVGNYNAFVVNIAACSEDAGEFICKVNVGDDGSFIRVGADFYGEHEPYYINLSNMGVELPEGIQKAIYDSNVHEDLTDNILINRKFKELLSNYWDIVANRGSYKSLVNSLDWFEWGDNLDVKEIWKRFEAGRVYFDDREVMTMSENKALDIFTNFIKTTYISLYCALQNETDATDAELNPMIEHAVYKWSQDDIRLKISLLAQFFGSYFMPIHLSVLHAVAEDKVFTNTIKSIAAGEMKRDDCFGEFGYVECNIKDNAEYKMTNVSVQVTNDTVFANADGIRFGVDPFPTGFEARLDNMQVFANQFFTGPGVIIPIHMTLSNQQAGDFIRMTTVDYHCNLTRHRLTFYDRFNVKHNAVSVNFNFFAPAADDYKLIFNFYMASGKTITRSVEFAVTDADNVGINIYKVKAKDDSNGFTLDDFTDMTTSKYFFKVQEGSPVGQYYVQHLPYMDPADPRYSDYEGVKLTRTVVVDVNGYTDGEIMFLRSMMRPDFLEFARYKTNANGSKIMTYLIFVSRKFYGEVPNEIYENRFYFTYNIIRNDLGFYPQFHRLELVDGLQAADYTVAPYEALCCAAEINDGDSIKPFRYGHMIADAEWSFVNSATGETIMYPASSRQPFIAKEDNPLRSGYYDVIFKYSLSNGVTDECRLNSAFMIRS